MANLTPWLDQKFYLADGITPNAGGKVFSYYPGTTTKKTTYVSEAGAANTNPIILNSAGECNLWLAAGGYKIVNAPANDTDPPAAAIKTWDNINVDTTGATEGAGVVDTITDLRALGEAAFSTVETLGYYAAGDAGGSLYYWDATSTAADNGGSIIAPLVSDGTGRWLLAGDGRINALQWGIRGGGATDNYAAIMQTAAVVAAAGGGDIRFPPGVYLCNTGLVLPNRVSLISDDFSPGNLNRSTAQLLFSGLGINTKAITLGEDVTLYGLVISGPGSATAGTYGVYGGEDDSEGFGVNTRIRYCTIEDFETNIVLSRWLNTIHGCNITDCITAIKLRDAANATAIYDNIINPGSASPKVGILIAYGSDRGPDGVHIHDNDIEAVYYGVVVTGGSGIHIYSNRFEIINKYAVNVRGNGTASDADISVNITENYIYGVAGSASSNGIGGILIEAGYTTIDNNEIRKYNSGANTGFQYGINFGGTGVIYHCLIGANKIDAYQAMANINDAPTKAKVNSRFVRTINYTWDLGDDPGNNVEEYFQFPLPSGYTALYSFRQMRTFNLDTLDAIPTEIAIGYRGAAVDLVAYLDNFVPSAVTQNLGTYATDAEWTAAGTTFLSLVDSRVYLIRMEPGPAVSGRIILTLVIDEFQH